MSVPRLLRPAERRALHERGARAALNTRVRVGVATGEAVSVFDAAEQLGLEVRFVEAPSLEGMYFRQAPGLTKPLIVVSSLRPAGRQAWTTAHELGHHVFGHGNHLDEQGTGGATSARDSHEPEEVLANSFAAMFLMPKAAVERGFRVRGINPSAPSAVEVYAVAGWLGVGYHTLVNHMRWTLGMIRQDLAAALLARTPKQVRAEIVGLSVSGDVLLVDRHWSGRAVDARVGDVLLVPARVKVAGRSLSEPMPVVSGIRVDSVAPGVAQLIGEDWAVFVRSARRDYHGRAHFRHVEPAGDDEPGGEEVDYGDGE